MKGLETFSIPEWLYNDVVETIINKKLKIWSIKTTVHLADEMKKDRSDNNQWIIIMGNLMKVSKTEC